MERALVNMMRECMDGSLIPTSIPLSHRRPFDGFADSSDRLEVRGLEVHDGEDLIGLVGVALFERFLLCVGRCGLPAHDRSSVVLPDVGLLEVVHLPLEDPANIALLETELVVSEALPDPFDGVVHAIDRGRLLHSPRLLPEHGDAKGEHDDHQTAKRRGPLTPVMVGRGG